MPRSFRPCRATATRLRTARPWPHLMPRAWPRWLCSALARWACLWMSADCSWPLPRTLVPRGAMTSSALGSSTRWPPSSPSGVSCRLRSRPSTCARPVSGGAAAWWSGMLYPPTAVPSTCASSSKTVFQAAPCRRPRPHAWSRTSRARRPTPCTPLPRVPCARLRPAWKRR